MVVINVGDQISNVLVGELIDASRSEIRKLGADIEKFVARENQQFFKLLVLKGIGVNRRPNLGQFTPPVWAALSSKYAARKKRLGLPRFFQFTGSLRDDLLGFPASSFLGNPKALIKAVNESRGTAGTTTFRNQGRAASGRFTTRAEVFRNVKAEITINPAPLLRDNADASDLFGNEPGVLKKFDDPKVIGKRPLIANFINWWINVHLRNQIQARFG